MLSILCVNLSKYEISNVTVAQFYRVAFCFHFLSAVIPHPRVPFPAAC